MDPKECLRLCDQAISDCCIEAAIEHLQDYCDWRRKGGFEPIEVAGTLRRGDDFANWCHERIVMQLIA